MKPIDLTLPGRGFATAWLNAWLSTAEDDERPVLYRTIAVEVFRRAVQLVATDSYTIIGSAVPCTGRDGDDLPTLDELPAETVVAMDHDSRAPTLMRWLLADCKAAAKAKLDEPTVHLAVRSAETDDTPTLDPEMDRRQLVITTNRESVTLDVFDGEYPPWRPLLLDHVPDPTATVSLAPYLLARLGKLRVDDSTPVALTFSGPLGIALVDVDCITSPQVFGGVMPVRIVGADQ